MLVWFIILLSTLFTVMLSHSFTADAAHSSFVVGDIHKKEKQTIFFRQILTALEEAVLYPKKMSTIARFCSIEWTETFHHFNMYVCTFVRMFVRMFTGQLFENIECSRDESKCPARSCLSNLKTCRG